jgi:hypothetical protein
VNAGWALRAGSKPSSTPTWSCSGADPEPDAAPVAKRLRLRQLLEPEQLAEEAACLALAAGGRGELDVVDRFEHRPNDKLARMVDEGLAELHTHLGGSVASDILWSLAHEQGIALPVKDYWEFDALVTVSDARGVENLDALDRIYHWTELIQSRRSRSSARSTVRSAAPTAASGSRPSSSASTR